MYRSAMSTRLSRGRSTPAIRAILRPLPSALPLLVSWVLRADDHDPPMPANQLAPVADLLHRRSDLHTNPLFSTPALPVPVDDAPPGQIVGRQLHQHPVPRE